MEMAETLNTPHLDVNVVEGGHRQGVPVDSWAIVKSGLAKTEFNRAGQELVITVPKTDGYDAVLQKLQEYSKAEHLPIAPRALTA